MPEHRNAARGENEWAATYGNLGMAAPARLMQLPIAVLDPWVSPVGKRQPFRPYSQAKLEELAENVQRNGIIEPLCVRPMPNGRFQIIAGHNRTAAAKLAGLTTVPALVQQLDDDRAAILMVDSNLQHRETLLPSEKAFAYLERMDAVRRTAERTVGRPSKNSDPLGPNFRWDLEVAADTNESATQIKRYIRLTYLRKPLLDMVDNGKLALRAGVELSYIPMEQQDLLLQFMLEYQCKAPSMSQAEQLRALAAAQELDEAVIRSVMVKTKAPKAQIVKLPAGRISSFFPPNTPPEQMEAEIYEALLAYRKNNITPASA